MEVLCFICNVNLTTTTSHILACSHHICSNCVRLWGGICQVCKGRKPTSRRRFNPGPYAKDGQPGMPPLNHTYPQQRTSKCSSALSQRHAPFYLTSTSPHGSSSLSCTSPGVSCELSSPLAGVSESPGGGGGGGGSGGGTHDLQELNEHCMKLEEEGRHHLKEQEMRMKEKRLNGEIKTLRKSEADLKTEVSRLRHTLSVLGGDLKGKLGEENTLEEISDLKEANRKLTEEKKQVEEEWERWKVEYDKLVKDYVMQKEQHRKELVSLTEGLSDPLAEKREMGDDRTAVLAIENVNLCAGNDELKKAETYWKEAAETKEIDKMASFRRQESSRVQTHLDNWMKTIQHLQDKITAKESDNKELRDKNLILQNDIQQVTEYWVNAKAVIRELKGDNNHHWNTGQEVQLHDETFEHRSQEEIMLSYQAEIDSLNASKIAQDTTIATLRHQNLDIQEQVDTLSKNITSIAAERDNWHEKFGRLTMEDKNKEQQLATLKDQVTSLIAERDSRQEEINRLAGEHKRRQDNTKKLRQERDDYKLQVEAFQKDKMVEVSAESIKNIKLQREVSDLKSAVADLEGETVRLRQENNHLRAHLTEQEGREHTHLTDVRQEREKLREEELQLREREKTLNKKLEGKEEELKEREKSSQEKLEKEERQLEEREIVLCERLQEKENQLRETEKALQEKQDQLTQMEGAITQLHRDREPQQPHTSYSTQTSPVEAETDRYEEEVDQLCANEKKWSIELRDLRRERDAQKERERNQEQINTDRQTMITTLQCRIAQMEQQVKNSVSNLNTHVLGPEHNLREQNIKRDEHSTLEVTVNLCISHIKGQNDLATKLQQEKEQSETLARQLEDEVGDLKKQLAEMGREIEEKITEARNKEGTIEYWKTENERNETLATELTTSNASLLNQIRKFKRERENYMADLDGMISVEENENKKMKQQQEQQQPPQLELVNSILARIRKERNDLRSEVVDLKQQLAEAEAKQRKPADHGTCLVEERQQHGGKAVEEKEIVTLRPKKMDEEDEEEKKKMKKKKEEAEKRKEEEEEEEKKKKKRQEVMLARGHGLPNLGKSCYMNAVVQCLYHLPPLRSALTDYATHFQPEWLQQQQRSTGVAMALTQLFGAMEGGLKLEVATTTRDLKRVCGAMDSIFAGADEQEAHDLYASLISWLHTDLSQGNFHAAASLFSGLMENKILCPKRPQEPPLSHNEEPFTSISLPVKENSRNTLQALLCKYFRHQDIAWICRRCEHTHQCSHTTHVRSTPRVLVIHFSRLGTLHNTRKAKVNFPLVGLSLEDHMVSWDASANTYSLQGVVCHEGNMRSGHYYSYCRYARTERGDGRWRLCNDQSVKEKREKEVKEDDNAHLLFYVKDD